MAGITIESLCDGRAASLTLEPAGNTVTEEVGCVDGLWGGDRERSLDLGGGGKCACACACGPYDARYLLRASVQRATMRRGAVR